MTEPLQGEDRTRALVTLVGALVSTGAPLAAALRDPLPESLALRAALGSAVEDFESGDRCSKIVRRRRSFFTPPHCQVASGESSPYTAPEINASCHRATTWLNAVRAMPQAQASEALPKSLAKSPR